MTKQDMLTTLAIKCPTWAAARSDLTWHNFQVSDEEALQIDEEEWLAERRRLLNLQWEDVPRRYKFVAMRADGERWFFSNPPLIWEAQGSWDLADGDNYTDYREDENPPLAIPAGYDWRNSLEERPV